MIALESPWIRGLLQGLFIGSWAAGSLLLTALVIRFLRQGTARRLRLRSLNGSPGPLLWQVQGRGRRTRFQLSVLTAALGHLAEELELSELRLSTEGLLAMMAGAGCFGWFGSDAAVVLLQQKFAVGADRAPGFHAWMLSGGAAFLAGSVPYFYVRFRVQRKRHRIALRMIMVVQNLLGHYHRRLTLADVIVRASGSMPEEIRSEWRRLELALHMKPVEEALYEFASRVDNEWGDDLADLLLIGAQYGQDVTEALHHLISRMQTAKRHEENRLAMITVYRLGTSFMVGFAFFVVGFNIYADGANYRHYFVDPSGRALLLISCAVMFISMVLVVRSGRRAF